MANTVFIVSAARTPIGKFGGMLAGFTHPDLGTIAVRAALERAFGATLPKERVPAEFPAKSTANESNEKSRPFGSAQDKRVTRKTIDEGCPYSRIGKGESGESRATYAEF